MLYEHHISIILKIREFVKYFYEKNAIFSKIFDLGSFLFLSNEVLRSLCSCNIVLSEQTLFSLY